MKNVIWVLFLFSVVSCIPFKIAPNIDDYKITNAKTFNRYLPDEYAFVFEDKKDADEFYHFVNTKFQLDFLDVEMNVPIQINDAIYYMSFYEQEKTTESANLVPILIDAILEDQEMGPMLEDAHGSTRSHWYILITVLDEDFKDCLNPNHPFQTEIIEALWNLKEEYQTTHHYIETILDPK